jgi:hypothetical protein
MVLVDLIQGWIRAHSQVSEVACTSKEVLEVSLLRGNIMFSLLSGTKTAHEGWLITGCEESSYIIHNNYVRL